jgi:hypothetical protein
MLSALPLCAQYPGQVAKSSKEAPELRSIAVLEWTGELDKPKACRLVPVAVLDGARLEGDQLQDGGIYLARPQPLALAGEVEYQLEQNGKPIGLFDIKNSGQEQGSWVGYGAWKQLAAPKPKPSMEELARLTVNDEDSDRPVLHRKHHADEGSAPAGNNSPGSGSGSSGSSGASAPAPAADPDRPTLHKKESSSGGSADAGASGGSSSPAPGPAPAPDSDQPTLHRKDSSDSTSSGSSSPDDSDHPVLKKSRKKKPEDTSYVDSLPDVTDPDRPRLKRGKPGGNGLDVLPSLMGLPADMQQTVAVSDAKSRPEHPWSYSWANPDDEAKMKSALEEIARDALGLKPPPPPPAPKRTPSRKSARPAPPPEPPPPPPLFDEQFRVFELAYGSGATLVLTARTDGPLAEQKFVALIAQPDLYGNVLVLLKDVAEGAHLDETPQMRLIDAVDVMADNRGELLFELRGATQRQFALYRILRGQAEQLFVSSGGEFGMESRE